MPLFLRFSPFLFLILLLPSCSLFEPPAEVPSFIRIDSIGLTTDPITQGTASHKIKDAWVYVDNQMIGVYELPSTIAVLGSGMHQVDIHPGIAINGILSTRGSYPFYTFYSQNVNLVAEAVTKINPICTYYPGTQFSWIENFDLTGMTMQTKAPTMDSLQRVSAGAFEGAYSAYASLNSTNYYFECASINSFTLPTDGSKTVYLEMNYKGTNTIRVGVIHISAPNALPDVEDTVLDIRPSPMWNKIYVDLTSVCGGYPSATGDGNFYIFIAAVLEPGLNNSEIYFDNLKLIHQ